jgi:thioredoxin reductase
MLDTAIIGAGPYGLSLGAFCKKRGIPCRIFGRPMDSWLAHMPKGMMLKSDGFASNLYDPDRALTLKQFCAEQNLQYADTGIPVRLDTFTSYGLAFKNRMASDVEEKLVVGIERVKEAFSISLEDGETVRARRVVLAVGITHFENMPSELEQLPAELVSHSFRHRDLEPFRGRKVIVVGGGSSATDLAGLLKESGAEVTLVARRTSLVFHTNSMGKPRPLWQRIRHPKSGLGPGLRSRFYANWPNWFRYLPERTRLRIVRTHLGPSGGWFARDKVIGKVPLLLGCTIERATARDGQAHLVLRKGDGTVTEVAAEHVIAATGYKVNVDRLKFLSSDIRANLKLVDGSPALSSHFESSIPGLYFAGLTAAHSFGPLMRFAFGARFNAERISGCLAKSASREHVPMADQRVVSVAK